MYVSVYMYRMYVHVCTYLASVCYYVYENRCTHTCYACIARTLHTHTRHTHTHTHTHTYTHTHMCVCVCVCVCVHVCVYVYMYTCEHKQNTTTLEHNSRRVPAWGHRLLTKRTEADASDYITLEGHTQTELTTTLHHEVVK